MSCAPFVASPPPLFVPAAADAAARAVLDAQQMQLDFWLRWQRACSDLQQELFDEWISHWGGGVPLDG